MQPTTTLTSLPSPSLSPSRQRERRWCLLRLTVARHDDTKHHRQQREVNLPSLLLACDQKHKNHGEERRHCTDGLVEGDREVLPQTMEKQKMALREKINFPKPCHGFQRLPSQHQHLRVQLESIRIPQLRVYYTLHSPFPTFFTSMCRSWWARTSPRTESSTALRRRSSKPVCFRSANAEGSLRTNMIRSRGRPAKLL